MGAKASHLKLYYADDRSAVVMEADVLQGIASKSNSLVFDHEDFIPYRGETKFRCRLRLAFPTSDMHKLMGALTARDKRMDGGSFSLTLNNGILKLKLPLETQKFNKKEPGSNPVSYFGDQEFPLLAPANRDTPFAVREANLPVNGQPIAISNSG